MSASVLGLDIGGANLKGAHSSGAAELVPFELWKTPARLTDALCELARHLPPSECWAVTMTGELCDCFATREHGVHAILDAVEQAAAGIPVHVWQTTARFVTLPRARQVPLLSAASNWLALSTFAGRYVPTGPALLVDVGSTTTDVVPLQDGQPVPRGRTDSERLRSRELVYTGVRRTPLCALLGPRVAAELFATTLDAYLVLGHIPEDPLDRHTADGCPATRAAAHARLARMYCADSSSCTEAETWMLADEVRRCQLLLLAEAVERVARSLPQKPVTLITAGSGEFLIQNLAEQSLEWSVPIVSLAGRLGPAISEAACAYAVAVLAEEHPDAEG